MLRTAIATTALAVLTVLLSGVQAVEYTRYAAVPVLVNNVGPFANPAESYKYYSLPFCPPSDSIGERDEDMGEVLAGDNREPSSYKLSFTAKTEHASVCHKRLTAEEIRAFIHAIEHNYVFEMFVDGLPHKGFIGEIERTSTRYSDEHVHEETHYYLFQHLDFTVAYNGPHVISYNLTTDTERRIELSYEQPTAVDFSYAVRWVEVDVPYIDRYFYHHQTHIADQAVEIHWLSILNSFVLVVLLVSLLAIILVHVLKKDFARYMGFEEEDGEEEDPNAESGWKLVHADVFRFPKHPMMLSAMVGTGAQIFIMTIAVLSLSVLGTFYPGNRGSVYTALLLLYVITSFSSGYFSARLYAQLGGEKWASNAVLTACLFALPFFATFSFVNSVAWYYGSNTALPFGTILLIICGWALVTVPFTVFGAMRGRKNAGVFDAPCKTTRVEREIPPAPWYRSAPVQFLIAGFLPFSAIYIELHYIFASVWGHRVYTLFGILSIAFFMLILVTAFITVALTYFQLAIEDHKWWWRSYLSGASTGLFMYGYAVFYFVYRSEMTGILQASFFFGYMLMVSYGFALMLGAISFWTAQKFVRYIYLSIHID